MHSDWSLSLGFWPIYKINAKLVPDSYLDKQFLFRLKKLNETKKDKSFAKKLQKILPVRKFCPREVSKNLSKSRQKIYCD